MRHISNSLRHLRVLRRRPALRAGVILSLLALSAAAFPALEAGAVFDTGVFQVNGNPTHDGSATYAWSDLFTSAGALKSGLPNSVVLSAEFFQDSAVPDSSYFTQNGAGVKDTDAIANWGCKTQNNPTAKDNLLNAYVAFLQMPTTAHDNAGDQVLYIASERQSNNGSSFAGFWLFKSPVSCNPATGAFTGVHTNGDLLVVSNYTNGGSTQNVTLYQWENGALATVGNGGVCGTSTPVEMCAIANQSTVGVPWSPGNTTAPSGSAFGLLPQTFVETGLDLTELLGGNVPCFTYFQAETRSSTTLSATLKDYTSGSFNNCVPPAVNTSLDGNGTSSVVVGSSVYDTATLSGAVGTPKGTLTYSLYTNSTCTVAATSPLFSNSTNSDQVTLNADGSVPSSPALTFSGASPPSYWWQASYSGDTTLGGRNLPAVSVCTSEPLTVTKAPTGITTTPQPASATVGGTLNDQATLSGLVDPVTSGTGQGSITFNLFDPNDTTCATQTGEPVYTYTTTATSNTNYTTTPGYTSNLAGQWHWVAMYSGDANNQASASTCASEAVSVAQATPSIATTPTPTSLVVGTGGFSDTADVTGGYHPGDGTAPAGTVTFKLYGPFQTAPLAGQCIDSGTGTNLLLTVSNVAATTKDATSAHYASNSATPTTPSYTPTQSGIYQWVASYAGNTNNAGTNSMCGDSSEMVTVNPASPSIGTTPSAGITIGNGNTISDTATVTGGYFPAAGTSPAGTVTFNLYGPFMTPPLAGQCIDTGLTKNLLATDADVTAAASPAPTQTGATYNSPSFTPTSVGIYQWVAGYNGNSNNNAVGGSCGTVAEQVTVSPATPQIASTILLTDTVHVSPVTGAGAPTGTVSFSLFGPFGSLGAVSCTGTAITPTPETQTLDGSGNATTPTAVPVAAGIYAWQVTYTSSAANYANTSTTCSAEEATIAYQAPSPIS